MSERKFKFVSPGVFLNEIDNSVLPREPEEIGPIVIGRTRHGPAMRPVRIESFAEFVDVFGAPHPGGDGTDVWRNGNYLTPLYAAYAAQAWLRNSSTINVVRLLGKEHTNKTAASEGSNGGQAGWATTNYLDGAKAESSNGGAYGMWVFPSEMSASLSAEAISALTGSGVLAAIWYVDQGSVGLAGTNTDGTSQSEAVKAGFIASDADGDFTLVITGSKSDVGVANEGATKIKFNFARGNKNYIRNVFNTNPTLGSSVSAKTSSYWLGETFETAITDTSNSRTRYFLSSSVGGGDAQNFANQSNKYWGIILGLGSRVATDKEHCRRHTGKTEGQTGWFFAQHFGTSSTYDAANMQQLFKFHGLDHGEWVQNNLKISVTNLNYSSDNFNKYGTFDIELRRIHDTDRAPQIVEKFSNCNLNPNSTNYVAAKVGDMYVEFDATERRLFEKGTHPNRSKYVRIEMNKDVDAAATNEEYLPWGVNGPPQYKDFWWSSGSVGYTAYATDSLSASFFSTGAAGDPDPIHAAPADGGAKSKQNYVGVHTHFVDDLGAETFAQGYDVSAGGGGITGSTAVAANALTVKHAISGNYKAFPTGSRVVFRYPKVGLRENARQESLSSIKDAYWGAWTGLTKANGKFDASTKDLVRAKSDGLSSQVDEDSTYTKLMWRFSLDDVSGSSAGNYYYISGSNKSPGYITVSSGSYKDVIDVGIAKFTTLFHGGVDGFDIKEKDPTRSGLLHNASTTPTETNSYVYNTYKEAIDIIKDPEVVEYNLATAPGLAHEPLTTHLMDVCESRGDALAIIDLKGDFEPAHESSSGKTYRTTVKTAVDNLRNRFLNTSYGCAYYPWVQIKDTLLGNLVYVPPSIAALGAMSYTDRVKAPWFAPAGFNRGGLSTGVAGLPVVNVTQRLTAQNRDDLYNAGINPIATFPNEGIVIFGQKTLQVTKSALDRINVRRLLLFVKKGISRISSNILFEPNVSATWDRFINRANPFLADVQARFGLDDYKLILDDTTTTPDLVDRNILYAKVFLRPARAIEFIAVDFIITNTGAAFED